VTLAEFLLARIAEDEAAAHVNAIGTSWRVAPTVLKAPQWESCVITESEEVIADELSKVDAEHIARWDPARVLAECEAKRRIIMWHGDRNDCWFNSHGEPCDHLTALALPYADHPSFRQEWKP